jgi:3-oxoacyl-[acyl-carrier-protein] synthase-3
MATVSRIAGTGSYLPARIVSNEEISTWVETSDEWIRERSGITQRHFAADGEFTSDLAEKASRAALEAAGIDGSELDLIVLATATPDHTFPATATKLQARLGMTGGFAFDVQAVCSGFLYALSVADSLIRQGQARKALVIGAETFSRILDWEDRGTCVLFGDGAGAIVLEAAEEGPGNPGILSTTLRSDGRHHDLLYVDGGPSTNQKAGLLRMLGREVFKHAVTNLAEIAHDAIGRANLSESDIDWIVPHQANKRIIDATARKLGVDNDKVILTVDKHANTSAASVPLALDAAIRDGRIKAGDTVLLEAMGGGLTWGAAVVRM